MTNLKETIEEIERMGKIYRSVDDKNARVACKNLNRNFIGIELDEGYFKIAEARIKACEVKDE